MPSLQMIIPETLSLLIRHLFFLHMANSLRSQDTEDCLVHKGIVLPLRLYNGPIMQYSFRKNGA